MDMDTARMAVPTVDHAYAPEEWADLTDSQLRLGLELVFFSHMELAAEADTILADYGFGRPHHRVLYFVARRPGITVNEILEILRVTNQALSRVMNQLIEAELIEQRHDSADRRRRQHYLTPKGAALDHQLCQQQFRRVRRAYQSLPRDAVLGFWATLNAMIAEEDRRQLSEPLPDLPWDQPKQPKRVRKA